MERDGEVIRENEDLFIGEWGSKIEMHPKRRVSMFEDA